MAATLLPLRKNGGTVTYIVNGETYATEKMKKNQDALSPSCDTPTKTGYTFAGWSLTEDGDVLTELLMGNKDITLYGVFVYSVTAFAYTGGMQSYVIPVTGLYLLEAYGAQGNGGAKGGYTKQYAFLTKGTTIFCCVGQSGGAGCSMSSSSSSVGLSAYNGGGYGLTRYQLASGSGWCNGAGGGCTHFATKTGTLKSLGSADNVLCVAGGGGGKGYFYSWEDDVDNDSYAGGTGGGASGGNGEAIVSGNNLYGHGGSQTSGGSAYYSSNAGSFGKGGNNGGGGGLYGGGGGESAYGAGGGSGYILSSTTTFNDADYANSTANGKNSGNGSASITFIAA